MTMILPKLRFNSLLIIINIDESQAWLRQRQTMACVTHKLVCFRLRRPQNCLASTWSGGGGAGCYHLRFLIVNAVGTGRPGRAVGQLHWVNGLVLPIIAAGTWDILLRCLRLFPVRSSRCTCTGAINSKSNEWGNIWYYKLHILLFMCIEHTLI